MKHGFYILALLFSIAGHAQASLDSTFSLMFNGGLSFTHANDPHINRWLAKYGYPTEPHVPSSLHFELSAIPVNSRQLYSIRVSSINSGENLSSFNLLIGLYHALIKQKSFLLFAGGGIGIHRDIIALDGNMPDEYKQLAARYNKPMGLRRGGLILEPSMRALWCPLHLSFDRPGGSTSEGQGHARRTFLQIGLFGGLGMDMDFNSRWRLGYFDNSRGKYSNFRRLIKPTDQKRVSEYGLAYNIGICFRLCLQ
ncbi:MAG TPA: hypothetical protein VGM31_22625 [Puia sp.]|jgi:hypothetical protein